MGAVVGCVPGLNKGESQKRTAPQLKREGPRPKASANASNVQLR